LSNKYIISANIAKQKFVAIFKNENSSHSAIMLVLKCKYTKKKILLGKLRGRKNTQYEKNQKKKLKPL